MDIFPTRRERQETPTESRSTLCSSRGVQDELDGVAGLVFKLYRTEPPRHACEEVVERDRERAGEPNVGVEQRVNDSVLDRSDPIGRDHRQFG